MLVAFLRPNNRYTVLYTKENTYQNNVTEDEMRPRPKKAPAAKPKGKAKTSAKKEQQPRRQLPRARRVVVARSELHRLPPRLQMMPIRRSLS